MAKFIVYKTNLSYIIFVSRDDHKVTIRKANHYFGSIKPSPFLPHTQPQCKQLVDSPSVCHNIAISSLCMIE